jgi:hypothetical protein
LDYPAAGGCPSLLVEPAATNLALYSEQFDNAVWLKANYITSGTPPYINVATAPDGTTTADKLIPSTANTQKIFEQLIGGTTGIAYTSSVFAKADGYDFLQLTTLSDHYATFNLIDGTFATFNGSSAAITAKTTSYPNGWWLCEITTIHAGSPRFRGGVALSLADTRFPSFAGDGTSGVLLWGAQLETGSVATSYIPTVAATATRNADVISKTGVSGFIGQTEGCIYVELNFTATSIGRDLIYLGDSNNALRIILLSSNAFVAGGRVAGSSVNLFTSTAQSTGIIKIAFAYKNGDSALYINGVQQGTSSSSSFLPASMSVINLGNFVINGSINDRIRAAAIYPTRLSNAELAALTTL